MVAGPGADLRRHLHQTTCLNRLGGFHGAFPCVPGPCDPCACATPVAYFHIPVKIGSLMHRSFHAVMPSIAGDLAPLVELHQQHADSVPGR